MRAVVLQPQTWSSDGRENLDGVRRLAERSNKAYRADDVIVLPELVGADLDRRQYVGSIRHLASALGAWVVGGSHHRRRSSGVVNAGVVTDPDGDVVTEYEKMNPYGSEANSGIRPGRQIGTFDVQGRRIVVFVCADFWFSRLFHATQVSPDLVAVPSFSLTQQPSPRSARILWAHMAVARASEFNAYVAISDWAPTASYRGTPSAGVAGVADPCPLPGHRLFAPVGRRRLTTNPLDMDRLDALRRDRDSRGFLPAVARRG